MAEQVRLHPTKRVSRSKYADDPLVPIRGDRLAAALHRDTLSVAAFARQHGESQQTLDYIVRGKTKRCRQSLVERVADALAVPMEWLTGDRSAFDLPEEIKADMDDTDDRYVAMFPLAWRDLIDRVDEIARRENLSHSASDRVRLALMRLTDPRMWRWRLFGGAPEPYLPAGFQPEEATAMQARLDDWIRATLADALSAILLPWFRREATLSVRALYSASRFPVKKNRAIASARAPRRHRSVSAR